MPDQLVTLPIRILGAFGKLPSNGDFLRRGFRAETIAAFDGWLQRRLAELPEHWFGDDQSPCRFLACPGVFGPHALVGILAPSCDRVGRIFPFMIGLEHRSLAQSRLIADEAWLEAAETLINHLRRGEGIGLPLDQALATLSMPEDQLTGFAVDPSEAVSYWWRRGDVSDRVKIGAAPDTEDFALVVVTGGGSQQMIEDTPRDAEAVQQEPS